MDLHTDLYFLKIMKDKLNILLLDCNEARLHRITSLINCCNEGKYCIDPRPSIGQDDYENNNYDIVFAHQGNKEVQDNDMRVWNSGKAVIEIFFSGGMNQDYLEYKGKWFVSASFIQKPKNICMLLKDIIKI